MNTESPSSTVARHVAALMRGEGLPAPLSADAELLRQAMRCLLASEAYPLATARERNDLALLVLRALNQHMAADAMSARTLGQARKP